ncbi:hypothetical protein SESBI_44012 [Sesbania bispinosa]|nr:hypothetical protein SESBI_44012 [Sesbania bispinosa]
MRLLGLPDIFTTNTTLTRVRAVPQHSFSIDTLEALNTKRPTIGILPSGLPWAKKSLQKGELPFKSTDSEVQIDKQIGNIRPPERIHQYIYNVSYSDHSNFAELEDFIKLVKPTSLKGTVPKSSCYIEPMHFFGRLCRVNQPTQQLHNRYIREESGKRVGAVNPKTSFVGDNVKLYRYRRKTLKAKFSGVRVSMFSILRRKRRGAKIVEYNSPDELGS